MFVVHGTKKFRSRVCGPAAAPDAVSTTILGDWYATVLFWKPQVALFVNEATLLPVLMPLAPAATVLDRFPAALGMVLGTHGVDGGFIERELGEMADPRLAKTSNRSVVGIMNEFTYLGGFWSDHSADLLTLSRRLADTPCGPLDQRHGSPDRELAALVAQHPAP